MTKISTKTVFVGILHYCTVVCTCLFFGRSFAPDTFNVRKNAQDMAAQRAINSNRGTQRHQHLFKVY